jgi:exosome complex component RRP45
MSRQLLQNIRDSKCIDMESLCILSREHVCSDPNHDPHIVHRSSSFQVWEISVNLHVIDYDGNILDCANLAALSAIAHFR